MAEGHLALALEKLASFPRDPNWKGVAAQVLTEAPKYCATVVAAPAEVASALLDRLVQERLRQDAVAAKRAEADQMRAEADQMRAEADQMRAEADIAQAEADRKDAEVRRARAGQQDAAGAVAGPSAGGAVATTAITDAARKDQDGGNKLLAGFANWVFGSKEKTS